MAMKRTTGVLQRLLNRLRGRPAATSEGELQLLIDESEQRGIIDEEEGEMLHSILELDETYLREIMVPRTDMVCVDAAAPLTQVLEAILQSGHTRIPIYKGNIDNIIGLVYAKDLLHYWGQALEKIPLEKVLRQPFLVPESKQVSVLLREFRETRVHIAIVIDEYGGTAGLITIEDLIEEIVGDIQDEYDLEEEWLIADPDGTVVVNGRLNIEEFEEYFDIEVEREKFDTISGYVIEQFGQVPAVGEKVRIGQFDMLIEKGISGPFSRSVFFHCRQIQVMMARIDKNLLLAAASGGLLALSFPRPDFYWLAWVALVPLLLVMEKRPFASGFCAGAVFFAAVLYWLNIVMTTFGGLNPFSSLMAYLLLISYLALFFGAATWLAWRSKERLGVPVLLSLPVIWVALEFLRGWLLTGFPWALIGYSQQNFSLAIQSADVTGVYGVGLMLVAVNALIAQLIQQPRHPFSRWAAGGVALLLVGHFGYGIWRSEQLSDDRPEQLQVALIQGNIEQSQKWNPALQQQTIEGYLFLSQQALAQNPELLIWPEAATPFYLQDPSVLATLVHDFPARTGVPLLVGTPAYQVAATGEYQYLNSAFLIGKEGVPLGRSDKVHLVPFGEYVPLKGLLSFVDKLVVGVGDFIPGALQPLPLGDHHLGVLVCYEVIFPYLARQHVKQGADLLVNITNDAWFGRSSAPYQHLAMARFRAIEHRIWLARSANTGISALIAPSGEVVMAGPIFEPLQMTGRVGLGSVPTFYTRFGDLFAYACLLLTVLLTLILAVVTPLRTKSP